MKKECSVLKRVACALLVALSLFAFAVHAPVSHVSAASVRNKKIVSLVYDDSTSMYGDKWSYANYAMQTFTAMLNSGDDLYITYMSNSSNSIKIDVSDLPGAVKKIRDHSDAGKTPFNSLQSAINKLKNTNDKNVSTQYWLVVFTDGDFNDANLAQVEDELDTFANEKMANDSLPQIIYMTIGDVNQEYTPHPSSSAVSVIAANSNDEIADCLFDIASRVTGRIRVDDKDIRMIDNKTLQFSSKIPLLNISVLIQNTPSRIDKIAGVENRSIPIKYEIPVSSPEQTISLATDEASKMHGIVTLAGMNQGNIPSGDYRISLTDSIDLKNVVIMYEPALELKIKLFDADGKELTDLTHVPLDSKVSAKADIYEFGTDNQIDYSLLSSGIKEHIEHNADDKQIDSQSGLKLDDLKLELGKNTVRACADLPGYFLLETSIDFTAFEFTVDEIKAELSYDGSPRRKNKDGTEDAENVVYITHLKDNKTGIRFIVYSENEPIDKTTAESIKDEFVKGLSLPFSGFKTEVQDDGSYIVYPNHKTSYLMTWVYWLRYKGEQVIGADFDEKHAEGTLEFKLFYDLKEIIIPIIALLVFLYFVWWILFKKHFPRTTLVMAIGRKNNFGKPVYSETDRIDLNWLGCFKNRNIFSIVFNLIILLLPTPSVVHFGGYSFTGQRSFVHRSNFDLIVRNVRGKAVDTNSPKPRQESVDSSVAMDAMLFIRDGESYVKFYKED
ncbi:MAG: VWA domain-containing protein [Clostridia bacterium]|nr:VWA domain-containing protein [Clostridia bacterium]